MPASVNVANTWRTIASLHVNVANTWRTVTNGYVNVAGTWRSFFTSVLTPSIASTVTISSNNSYYPSTLTGTNFYWTNSTSLTYVFQKSSDNSSWSNIGSATSIANPSSGSSNTVTYALTVSDFPAFASYFRFVVTAVNSTYSTSASSQSSSVIVYYGTPTPDATFPSITGSTTVGNTAYGNIGTWSYSPTSYDYRWFFMSGATSYPLTFSQARSVSNKTLSGFSATLVTSANHGYKANDTVIVSAMDTLFNGSHTITSKTDNTISLTLPTPTGWSASIAYSVGDLVSYLGDAYYASITMPAPSLFSIGNAYSVGSNAWDGFTRYRCIQSISAVSAWSSSGNYATGSIIHYNATRWLAQQNSGPGYLIPGTSTPVGPQTPSSGNYLYWSEVNVSLSNTSYWQNAYPYNSSYWTLQSFSNTVASGATTAPNYYEATVSSSTSISLTVPTTDYRSGLDMIGKALYFGVKAYNLATPSPSEYSNYKLVYGVPVITLGTPTYPSGTQAQIPFTHVYMTKYSIDVVRAGASLTGYPTIITSSTSPITISGLTGGLTYTVNVYPINGEDTYGSLKTTSIAPPAAPSPPTITSSSSTTTSITLNFTLGANSTSTRAYINGSFDGSTVGTSYTFSGLAPGTAYTLALYGYNGTTLSTTSSGGSFSTSTGAALTPTFGGNTSVSGGFTGSVTNYNASYTWGISTNSGSVSFGSPSGSTYPFTVSGLGSGASATVTVTTSRTGYSGGSAQTTGTASVTLFAPSAPSPSVTSGPTQTTVTISWSAPSNGGSAITSYEAQLGSSGYTNIGNVLSQSLSGLTASTSYTYFVRAINAIGTSTAGSVSFTTQAAPVVPSVTQIQSTNTNAGPTFMSFAITCANALSCDVRVDRAASSPTPPTSSYTAGTSTLLTLSGGVGTVNSTTTTPPAGSNAWYRIRVIPYTGASRTGTAGTQVASSWKRNTATSTTTTNPSPTPFGDASV